MIIVKETGEGWGELYVDMAKVREGCATGVRQAPTGVKPPPAPHG
ncbi:hypothetical protein APS67_005711 [Streptomyces sp. AVP053U2]|nr:hypothetical protein APS67_005711 [Streptomyces sp. AVP053U2]